MGLNVSDAVFCNYIRLDENWERFCCNDCVTVMMVEFLKMCFFLIGFRDVSAVILCFS